MDTTQGAPFGVLLKQYRVAAGLSQEALAERARMSVRGISDLERGVRRAPYKETLVQLIDALNLTPEERVELEALSQRFRTPSRGRVEAAGLRDVELSILETKLRLPPAPASLVPRARLVERLHRGLQGPLTLIAAPAGCGKTTLLRAWRASGNGRSACLAWVSLASADNDPVVFWSYICTALDRVAPGVSRASLALLQSPQSPDMTAILTQLVNALSARSESLILALDDYHVIESEAIHEALAFLLEHLPPQLHLLIASRVDPPMPLSRLRVRGQVTELIADDLRFTSEEAVMFLRDVMSLALTAGEIDELEARTEGWAAGLQLAALSLQGRSPEASAHFIASFSGSHRHVVDYLADEVLARQSDVVQAFLVRTSILDRLSASLCAFVMDGESTTAAVAASYTLLEELERRNVFLVALDDQRQWYRYHHLFRDALRNRLQTSHPGIVPLLHRRASDWYAEQRIVDDAISHALQAGAFEPATELIDQIAWKHVAKGTFQTLRTWFAALPEPLVRARPRLCLAQACLSLDAGSVHHAETLLLDAEAALPAVAMAPEARRLEGEIEVVRALLAYAQGDSSQVILHGHNALRLLDGQSTALQEIASMNLSAAYLGQGDLVLAAQSFGLDAARARATGNVRTALIADVSQSYVQRALGDLRTAAETCRGALDWGAEHGTERLPVTGGLHLNLADLLREWNDLDAALHHALQAKAVLQELGRVDLQILGFLGLAGVVQARGELDRSLELLSEARHLAEQQEAAWSVALLGACQAQVWLAQGKLEEAFQWEEQSSRQETPRPSLMAAGFIYAHEHIMAAPLQILLVRARTTGERAGMYACLARLEEQRREAERAGVRWLHIKTLVLEALAFQTLGDRGEALAALGRALALAEPEGYVRIFADEGAPLGPLVRDLADLRGDSGYIHRVLTALVQSYPSGRPRTEPHRTGGQELTR